MNTLPVSCLLAAGDPAAIRRTAAALRESLAAAADPKVVARLSSQLHDLMLQAAADPFCADELVHAEVVVSGPWAAGVNYRATAAAGAALRTTPADFGRILHPLAGDLPELVVRAARGWGFGGVVATSGACWAYRVADLDHRLRALCGRLHAEFRFELGQGQLAVHRRAVPPHFPS